MEDKSTTSTSATAIPTTTKNGPKSPLDGEKNKKKKRGAFALIKAAMHLMRGRPNHGKPKAPESASTVTLKKIVGSIRPLHLQDNQSPPRSIHQIPASPTTADQESDDVSTAVPPSPHRPSASSDNGMSQYGSATNLQELDKGSESRYASAVNLQALDDKDGETEDDDESDDGIIDNGGDEMIDMKADEFIAKFYLQMRVQHSESVEPYNKVMMARGMH